MSNSAEMIRSLARRGLKKRAIYESIKDAQKVS